MPTSKPAQTQVQLKQFLQFELPPQTSAMLPTSQLTEILSLSLGQVVPIPDLPSFIMGVCNWRGEVLWLVDLGCLLGFEPLYSQGLYRGQVSIVVAHHQQQTVGLAVEKINQMLWCDPNRIRASMPSRVTPELAHCLRGYWSPPGDRVSLILDGESLITSLR